MPKDVGLFARVILLSMPAIVMLVLWARRGVRSKTNYFVCWVNAVVSLLWIVAVISRTVSVALLLVFCPFVLGIVSACMLVWPGATGEGAQVSNPSKRAHADLLGFGDCCAELVIHFRALPEVTFHFGGKLAAPEARVMRLVGKFRSG